MPGQAPEAPEAVAGGRRTAVERAVSLPTNGRRRRVRDSVRSKLWLIPMAFLVGAVLLAFAMLEVDDRSLSLGDTPFLFRGTVGGAQLVLTTIATSMLTFMGVVFSISILALQIASQQFSPRALRNFVRDRRNQVVLGLFTATFVYSIVVLGSIQSEDSGAGRGVTRPSVSVAFLLVFGSLCAFLYYLHHMSQSIRVVHIIDAVARETRQAIDDNYPPGSPDADSWSPEGAPTGIVTFAHTSGVIAAVDIEGMVELARRNDCLLRFLPTVGEFVSEGESLCEVYGSMVPSERSVVELVDVQRERTMYQDPAFGFRQLVDIAEKALSPAINDPTTAVQCVDRLADFLRRLALRPIPSGVERDATGVVRMVRRVPGWDAFVSLAFDEVRDYGAGSLQVARRVRSALDELLDIVPDDRRRVVQRQRELLHRATVRAFPDWEEREAVTDGDAIGIGGD